MMILWCFRAMFLFEDSISRLCTYETIQCGTIQRRYLCRFGLCFFPDPSKLFPLLPIQYPASRLISGILAHNIAPSVLWNVSCRHVDAAVPSVIRHSTRASHVTWHWCWKLATFISVTNTHVNLRILYGTNMYLDRVCVRTPSSRMTRHTRVAVWNVLSHLKTIIYVRRSCAAGSFQDSDALIHLSLCSL